MGQDLTLKKLVEVLHPTAAICGLPTQIARDFILENEGYEREYYTGYLGEWIPNQDGSSEAALYVNLRCMKIEGSALDAASVYVGGGITAQSDPHDEWEETVEKSKVMKRFLSIKTTSSN